MEPGGVIDVELRSGWTNVTDVGVSRIPRKQSSLQLDGPAIVSRQVDLHEEVNRLMYLARLPVGWDSYDADAISHDALKEASIVIAKVAIQSGVHPYAISPLSGGGVQIEWHGTCSEIEVEVSPNKMLSYLLVEDPNGESRYIEKNEPSPDEVIRAVSNVVR